jgi:hypothetical protein
MEVLDAAFFALAISLTALLVLHHEPPERAILPVFAAWMLLNRGPPNNC